MKGGDSDQHQFVGEIQKLEPQLAEQETINTIFSQTPTHLPDEEEDDTRPSEKIKTGRWWLGEGESCLSNHDFQLRLQSF